MNRSEKIGQTLMLGFDGTAPSTAFIRFLEKRQPGGIILFSRNLKSPDQIANLTNALQQHSRIPLLIAIDQEGGRVSRLPRGFTVLPSALAIASLGSIDTTYRAAAITAQELRSVGINMNMAPVLDVDTNPNNPVIGDRAYGKSATIVSTMGLATLAGLQDNGVVACGKHFPGHGDTDADSHETLPVVTREAKKLVEVELRPFAHAIENRLTALMTAHVLYKSLDPEWPATLSSTIITGLLRERMGFEGLVVSDDLLMGAIAERYDPGTAAVSALRAGVDLLLYGKGPDPGEAAFVAIEEAIGKGSLPEAMLDRAVLRNLAVKERFVLPYSPVDRKAVNEVVGVPAHRRFLEELTASLSGPPSKTL